MGYLELRQKTVRGQTFGIYQNGRGGTQTIHEQHALGDLQSKIPAFFGPGMIL